MLEPADEVVRSGAALRLFLVGSLEPDEARVLPQRYLDQAEANLTRLRAQLSAQLRAQLGVLPEVQDWARWGLEQFGKER
jgi:hypothetical protein